MRRRKRAPWLALVFTATLALGGAAVWWASRPVMLAAPRFVEIPPGTPVSGIARLLAEQGIVRSRWSVMFLHYARPTRLKAGDYRFEGLVAPADVYRRLERGDVYVRELVIPEGYNIFETARAVEQQGFTTEKDFLDAARDTALVTDLAPRAESLEGFLFPDTYHFGRRADARVIVSAMVARFRQVYAQVSGGIPAAPPFEVVTLASLVEEETGRPEERALVAGVYRNRLARGLRLQCDPTVAYAALLAGKYRGTIYRSDLERNSPYNTYVRAGLPPGPIANPGRRSLEAALRPAPTAYLYFVSDAGGGHVFATTLSQHQRNVAAYRRKMQSRSKGSS